AMHVIATAGHVDHGKSMLVRALTGMEPDRWEAEQRRGMTIDLGYAWMTLPAGEQVAFVDVPGHERFVTNMLAGAGPAPAVVFVVAADEGWKPQSAEHLAAIDALGVRNGILVISRADLADPGPALRQAAEKIAETSLGRGGGCEAVAVSALTGQGMPDLVAALGRLVERLPRPDPRREVRLWLDRVFAIRGSGTVVTGTLQEGTVRTGDELTATPASRPLRIRGLQSLGAPVAQASGVARVALNLRGVATGELGRGMALITPGRWTTTSVIDVRLAPQREQPAGDAGRLPPRLTLHIGAARAVAQVRPLGDHIVRLSLDHPLPLHVGDRVLLRDPGAAGSRATGRAILGATVLDVAPPRLRGRGAAAAANTELASWPEPPAAADLLRRHRLLRASDAIAMGLRDLSPPVSGDWLADPAHWRRLRKLLAAAVTAHAERDPLAPGLPLDAARAELRLPDRSLIVALASGHGDGEGAGPISVSGGYLRAGISGGQRTGTDHTPQPQPPGPPSLPAPVAKAVQAVLDGLAGAPFSAPDSERLRVLGLDARGAAAAERAGLLWRLPGNVLLAPDAGDRAARILAGLPQPFTAAEARQALKSSRRVVIPLLEFLDREGITRRLADDRRMMREARGRPDENGER
ncbi:MAG TPA: selenocysteine-specific translation elongation factor, partial [Streptosporangiaceae bacterium]|nr:selenocysteine-specific translation elongation factor [Streptosporangiaceae bacterium]